jgi:anaerobic ribonucleoside-triphosphate reductase
MEAEGADRADLDQKVIGVDLDEGEVVPGERVAKKKKKKRSGNAKAKKAADAAAANSTVLEEVNLNTQSQALTESLMQDHQRESEESHQPAINQSLDAFKEDMDKSYQASNSTAPVDQDRISDTGSDNNSDISTGSDSSTNSDYGSKLLSRGPL